MDEQVIADLIETERNCCPFFEMSYDATRRTLTVHVADPSQELGPGRRGLRLRGERLARDVRTRRDTPVARLGSWLDDARAAGAEGPVAMGLSTVGADGRPTARIVALKRLEENAVIFTTALWTRKARELALNPNVALLFHWPALGRQVQISGSAVIAERELAEELFAERKRSHRLQTLVSRQGEPIEDVQPLRERLARADEELGDRPVSCPPDWGAFRVIPVTIEFWQEASDRLHDRLLYERFDGGWRLTRLAP